MKTIDRTGLFKRDYRRASKGRHRDTLDSEFAAVLGMLASDQFSMRDIETMI